MLDPNVWALNAETVGFRVSHKQPVDWRSFSTSLQNQTDSIKTRRELKETPISELHIMGGQLFGYDGNSLLDTRNRQKRQMNGYRLRSFTATDGPITLPTKDAGSLNMMIPASAGLVQYNRWNSVTPQTMVLSSVEPLNTPMTQKEQMETILNMNKSMDEINTLEEKHHEKRSRSYQNAVAEAEFESIRNGSNPDSIGQPSGGGNEQEVGGGDASGEGNEQGGDGGYADIKNENEQRAQLQNEAEGLFEEYRKERLRKEYQEREKTIGGTGITLSYNRHEDELAARTSRKQELREKRLQYHSKARRDVEIQQLLSGLTEAEKQEYYKMRSWNVVNEDNIASRYSLEYLNHSTAAIAADPITWNINTPMRSNSTPAANSIGFYTNTPVSVQQINEHLFSSGKIDINKRIRNLTPVNQPRKNIQYSEKLSGDRLLDDFSPDASLIHGVVGAGRRRKKIQVRQPRMLIPSTDY